MKRLLSMVLCLCMIVSIAPTIFVFKAEASEGNSMTFTYAYDVQRNPAFPANKGDKVTVSGFQKPLRAGASATGGMFRYENNKGEWKLTEVGPYGEISGLNPAPSSNLRPVVKSIADTYGISDMKTIVIHKLTDKMGNHVAYGVIISRNESNGYVLFLTDLFNQSGAGFLLSKSEVKDKSITFTSDKTIETASVAPTYNTSGYKKLDLHISEIPEAGKKPFYINYHISNGTVTMQEWSGSFDENGCFKPGEAYTLTAEFTLKEDSRTTFNTAPGTFEVEFFYNASSKYIADIISHSETVVKAKYTFYTDDDTDFAIDEYGTATAKLNLDVYKDASATGEKIGEIKINETVKVLRAYVNGDIVYSKHMIVYNGGIGYVRGCNSFGKDKYFRSVKVEGKIDPNNVPADRVPDFGKTEKMAVSGVGITSFKAEYGTKPVLTVFDSDYYKAESIVYSTDMVNEKLSVVTATVTFVPTSPNYIERIFDKNTTAKNGEILSLSEKQMVVRYSAFTGMGDTIDNVPDGVLSFGRKVNGGEVYVNKYAYAKAKVNKIGGVAKIYDYPAMIGSGADAGEELYIRDETVTHRFPGINAEWVMVSKERTGTVYFIPKVFLGEYEYLGTYMEGAPADDKNTPFKFAGGSGTVADPYLIQTADQLNAVRYGPMLHYKLIADIDLSSWGNWVPIGGTPGYGHMGGDWNQVHNGACAFLGSFDGNGHVVSGMKIIVNEATPYMTELGNSRAYGLFANLATNPTNKIKNLGVVNYTIDVTYTDVKQPIDIYAAAIVGGMNNGMDVYNCYAKDGRINININGNFYANPRLLAYVGGICSYGNGCIEKCFNTSDITITHSNVQSTMMVGGIFGSMILSHIRECYNTGNITLPVGGEEGNWMDGVAAGICATASTYEPPALSHRGPDYSSAIQNCYNTGNITARNANGIFGFTDSDIYLENCYNIGKLKGNAFDPGKQPSRPSENTIIAPFSNAADYPGEYIKNCSTNGNGVSGSAWKASSLGRMVLAAVPEDNQPSTNYQFVATGVGGFNDVKSDAWYASAVSWALAKKITSGTSATTFSPDATCTKAQIITFLWRAKGSPKSDIKNPFTDVSETDYYYDAARWAYEWGIIKETTFEGNTPCTRNSTVLYMWKSVGAPQYSYAGNFYDVAAGTETANAVAWALANGITSGTSDTTFSPDMTCTRGQIVTFLNRAFK